MRRHALFFALITLPWLNLSLPAQEAPPTAALPVRSYDDEDIKILRAKVEDLTADNKALRESVTKLERELARLWEEVAKPDRNKDAMAEATEKIEKIKAAIKAVDDNRLADQKKVMAEFETLRKILEKGASASRAASGGTVRPAPATPNGNGHTPAAPKDPENGSTYQIRDGDTLIGIVTDLKKHGVKITQKEIMDANPKVNWNRLHIGQTIFIPVKLSQ